MNKDLLRGALTSNGITYTEISKKLGISLSAFSDKINGHTQFTLQELLDLKAILNLEDDDFKKIFLVKVK